MLSPRPAHRAWHIGIIVRRMLISPVPRDVACLRPVRGPASSHPRVRLLRRVEDLLDTPMPYGTSATNVGLTPLEATPSPSGATRSSARWYAKLVRCGGLPRVRVIAAYSWHGMSSSVRGMAWPRHPRVARVLIRRSGRGGALASGVARMPRHRRPSRSVAEPVHDEAEQPGGPGREAAP